MLNSQDLKDKQIRAAIRELKSLNKYDVIKLEKPIQRGWRRLYVFADHAKSRKDRPILEAILARINNIVVYHRRDFLKRKRRTTKLVEIEQPLRVISQREWDRRDFFDTWRSYFRREFRLDRRGKWVAIFEFKQPSLFRLKVERNWLWYFRVVDPAAETRSSELERWLNSANRRQRYDWLKGVPVHYYFCAEKSKILDREYRKMITEAVEQFSEVDQIALRWRAPISLWPFSTTLTRRSPMQRRRAQTSFSAGASPAAGRLVNDENRPGALRQVYGAMETMTNDGNASRIRKSKLRSSRDRLPAAGRRMGGYERRQTMLRRAGLACDIFIPLKARSVPAGCYPVTSLVRHQGGEPLYLDSQPDKRAGAVSKTVWTLVVWGACPRLSAIFRLHGRSRRSVGLRIAEMTNDEIAF